ncbi:MULTISPECIES: branched-chain amino acid ABC transporter permease [unclassified Chelatococcus]|uniref:branched-chain amino acid ABC transporter permease n=1 Tax=unclassified Chelatococcus TaxID=2638111 RepID=UPI001BCB8D51|nr:MULTISPECIES: branched-chain amino acid ABC transporter permease [unclassified Chelatococcus]CAH1653398.1 Leucine/isoleucine/valine transporter permease subunit [Hyphomicrobiales bacterium]MBS7742906.1 branched-chain amino acid ABC transporter permease [Chelatococcus sp. HY11]MBX3541976.1 branched-chain amino acid ABC transporter permease [Chelatococcus sp.]MCO5074132.1 branched-chain amino acid ABC transporter permease [Chelatococcus sp.]CAH1694398.1 Leucine/isoleucine/valine transporter p
MDYLFAVLTFFTIYAVLATSLNIVVGHAGLLSIGHAALFCVGAYVSALVSLRLGLAVPLAAVLAVVVTAIVGGLVTVPLLRLSGDYFILGSLGIQIIVVDIIRNLDALTEGPRGLASIPRPSLGGLAVESNLSFAIVYGLVAVTACLLARYLMRSPYGRVLEATRDDEEAASALGRNVVWTRVRAFILSAALAGLAGSMYAHFVSFIDPTSFGFSESIYILSMVVIGGMGTARGPLLGAALLLAAPEIMRFVGASTGSDAYIRQLLYAVLLIAFAYFRPQGIGGKRLA